MKRGAAHVGWLLLLLVGTAVATAAKTPAGPPFPDPVLDQVIYDFADILSPTTEARATATIVAIEQRVAAEVVVYTQYKPEATTESTEQDAIALIDQWGVGRAGFDDGLAIMWNVKRLPCQPGVSGNGEVQLYGAPGYAAAYLSNSERQQIFEDDMVPLLRQCDEDGALLAALAMIDANATPEHARVLAAARIIDAAIGLIGAPLVFLVLVGWAAWSWLRYGRDPVYLDSPSILMPAPPPDLTAASGAVVWEGRSTRRALTTAMLDLASRGELSFRDESGMLSRRAGIQVHDQLPEDPYVIRNRRRPLSDAETYALERLEGLARSETDLYLEPDEILKFGQYVPKFDEKIEKHVVDKGWFRDRPSKVTSRWTGRGWLAITAAIVIGIIGFNVPSAGLVLLAIGFAAGGVAMLLIARWMPARTMAGAIIYAMLAAYRRTLQKTMEQARSMQQVVQEAELAWLKTPDQAAVWGVALGLQREVEEVIERSVEDAAAGVTAYNPWIPAWYSSSTSSSRASQPAGFAPGLFSASAVPSFGGMMAALGSIGNSPSSSGSGSGGFGGGGSGGGGGGAGGGY